ncbi:hypothetical protein SNEBB_007818 [Seison nebaliae]|nr:hypothetical protein SNEBB_007818 [Seison nebaliae]
MSTANGLLRNSSGFFPNSGMSNFYNSTFPNLLTANATPLPMGILNGFFPSNVLPQMGMPINGVPFTSLPIQGLVMNTPSAARTILSRSSGIGVYGMNAGSFGNHQNLGNYGLPMMSSCSVGNFNNNLMNMNNCYGMEGMNYYNQLNTYNQTSPQWNRQNYQQYQSYPQPNFQQSNFQQPNFQQPNFQQSIDMSPQTIQMLTAMAPMMPQINEIQKNLYNPSMIFSDHKRGFAYSPPVPPREPMETAIMPIAITIPRSKLPSYDSQYSPDNDISSSISSSFEDYGNSYGFHPNLSYASIPLKGLQSSISQPMSMPYYGVTSFINQNMSNNQSPSVIPSNTFNSSQSFQPISTYPQKLDNNLMNYSSLTPFNNSSTVPQTTYSYYNSNKHYPSQPSNIPPQTTLNQYQYNNTQQPFQDDFVEFNNSSNYNLQPNSHLSSLTTTPSLFNQGELSGLMPLVNNPFENGAILSPTVISCGFQPSPILGHIKMRYFPKGHGLRMATSLPRTFWE